MEEKMSSARVKRLCGAFTFRVEIYSGLSTRVGDSTESPEFDLAGHLWQLRIFPGGSLEVHRGHVSFYLASKSTRSARASYKLLVLNQSPTGGDEVFASAGIRTFEARGMQVDGWGRDKFMTCAALLDPTKQFCVNDTVIFKVEITVYGELESAGFPVVSSLHSASSTCLTKCMHTLLMQADSTNADLLLLVGNGAQKDQVWCHRCILGARSDVFKAMLCKHADDQTDALVRAASVYSSSPSSSAPSTGQSSPASATARQPLTLIALPSDNSSSSRFGSHSSLLDTCRSEAKENHEESKLMGDDALSSLYTHASFLESKTGVVVIPDVETEVMREFLVFLYTDALSNVNVLGLMANKLLAVSAKYQVPALFSFVEEFLCLQLNVDSALEALRLADTFDAPRLKDASLKLVVQNALVLADSSEYKSLHASLQAEVERQLEEGQRLQQCCLTGSVGSGSGSGGGSAGHGGGGGGGGGNGRQCSIM